MQSFYLVGILFFMKAGECSGSQWWFRTQGTHWLSVTFGKSLHFSAFPFKLSCLLRIQVVQSRTHFTCCLYSVCPSSQMRVCILPHENNQFLVAELEIGMWHSDCPDRWTTWTTQRPVRIEKKSRVREKNKDIMKVSVWLKNSKSLSRSYPMMLQLISYLTLFKQQHDTGNIKSFL